MDFDERKIDDEDLAPECAICHTKLLRYGDQKHRVYDLIHELGADLCPEHTMAYDILERFVERLNFHVSGSTILNFLAIEHKNKR